MTHTGIDGCPAGWIAISHCDGQLDWVIATSLDSLLPLLPASGPIFIDMPIGLSIDGDRACDVAARHFLGSARRASIFSAPLRQLLECTNHQQANILSRTLQNKGLSIQSWHIVPKIRAVDAHLQQQAVAERRLREAHPEVAFQALADAPLRYSKKDPEGLAERLAILGRCHDRAQSLYENILTATKRKDVARDDIVDALCLALMPGGGRQLHRLPKVPHHDSTGLPMEICYFV